jgi:surfeit locus 1 family protein
VTEAAERAASRSLLMPGIAALAAFAVLIGLGTWQVKRLAWKEGLIASLQQRLSAAPVALPPRPDWSRFGPANDEYRRVKFTAAFQPDQEAYVYTSGSSLRPDVSGPGYWVFAPAVVDGGIVVVNRGFVPQDRRAPQTRPAGKVTGPLNIVGALRWPDKPGMFTPAAEPGKNTWYSRDHLAMAVAKGWNQAGEVASFYVEQEAPVPPGGLPKPGRLKPNLPNNHLQYAITWYGLALMLVGVFTAFAWSRRRKPNRAFPRRPVRWPRPPTASL